MAASTLDKIFRKIAYWKYFSRAKQNQVNSIPFLTKNEIDKKQKDKLKYILHNAINTVPFYKKSNIKINFDDFSVSELNKFPIINKEIIRNDPKAFLSTKSKGIVSQTSGSTGIPFEYYLPYKSAAIELLTANRAWGMGEHYEYQYKDPIVMMRSYSPKQGEPITLYDSTHNYYYISAFHINDALLNQYIDYILNSKAKILRGYPSSIYIFTLLLKKHNIKINQIKSIITSSETLLPMYREEIEKYWGISVLDWYGQNENTVTVQQCWAGNYHNNDDYGIIEINEQNSIIATSLNNDVMPFIRYNTNDKAIPYEGKIEKCICGRNFSIPFKGIEGRSEDILIKMDGTWIPTANFSTAMKAYTELNQFQVIQAEDRSLQLNLVINPEISKDYIDKIKLEFIQRLGELKIEVNITEQIQRDPKTGKVKVSIQKGKL
ncbi:MAG: hypothetical protein ACK45U_02745 [bacterium]